jgi:hypothetical protein
MAIKGVKHIPTEETKIIVKELYAAGIPRVRIADRLDIDESTLNIHYKAELDHTKDQMTAALATGLYAKALEGNQAAQEFWLKCQGRWSYAKPPEDKERDNKVDALLEKLIDKL